MSFTSSSQSLRARLHLTHVPAPALAGCAVLALAVVAAAAWWLLGPAGSPSFAVSSADTVQEVPGEGAAASDSDGQGEAGQNAADGASGSGAGGVAGAGAETGLSAAQGHNGSSGAQGSGSGAASKIAVHVAGAVARPGVYELEEGARVQDAVSAAGGATENAACDAVNLARVLADGEQVRIPTQEEAASGAAAASAAGQSGLGGNAATSGASGGVAAAAGGRVNINTATAAQLDELPGVGPATAAAIIAEREQGGPFATPEDLMRTSGIGEKKFAKLKDSICV